jgi:hypothetical protein
LINLSKYWFRNRGEIFNGKSSEEKDGQKGGGKESRAEKGTGEKGSPKGFLFLCISALIINNRRLCN